MGPSPRTVLFVLFVPSFPVILHALSRVLTGPTLPSRPVVPSASQPLESSRLLHVDDSLCVVDKPAGTWSQEAPKGGRGRTNVLHQLAARLVAMGQPGRVFAVHRLDLETSGALIVARTPDIRAALERLLRDRAIDRVYHAIVLGTPHPRRGRLESRLADDGDVVRVVTSGGRKAVTHFDTVAVREDWSVVVCKLETGRRNQIRVQLADIGCPVAGDRKYGRDHAGFRRVRARRAMLHASGIGFAHPATGRQIRVIAPLPEDFRAILGEDLASRLEL